MAYYPEAGNHIRDKIKVVLDLSGYERITKNKTIYARAKSLKDKKR